MKAVDICLLASLCGVVLLAGPGMAQESPPRKQEKQDLPAQGAEKKGTESPFPGDDMPTHQTDLRPHRMPMPKMWGMQTDPENGRVLTYTDPQKGLRYDFEKKEITDLRTGKVYTFSGKDRPRQPDAEPGEDKSRHEKKPLLL